MGWLAFMIVYDAIISPSGTDNIYIDAMPCVIYGWARAGTFFKTLIHVGREFDIPRPVLWLTLALSVFWTLPFPPWEQLISVMSVALALSYAIAPITVVELRHNTPNLPCPFRAHVFRIIDPVPFVISMPTVFWSDWGILSWLLRLQIVMPIAYVPRESKVPVHTVSLAQQAKSSSWPITFYALVMLSSWLGNFGGIGVIDHSWDTVVVTMISLGIYYWGE